MKEKKKNIIIYFIEMSLTFMLVFFIWNVFVSIIPFAVDISKYSLDFIAEAFFALMVLVVMLLSKNGYVFTEKKVGFFKSLILGLPIFLFSILALCINVSYLPSFDLFNTIGVFLFSMSIGVAEEFLCRGWLQNEFLERFSKTRGQVILSIVLSSLIFGFMHIGNIGAGQSIFDTILQIAQATASGMFLGSIYYRSKNIWSVIFLHGFYDFSLFITEANVIKDCTTVYNDDGSMIFSIVSSIVIMIFWILGACINLRKSKVMPLIDGTEVTDEIKKKDVIVKIVLIVLMVVLFFSFMTLPSGGESVCYDFKEKEMENIEVHYSTYEDYDMVSTNMDAYFKVYRNDDGYVSIKNIITNNEIVLDYEYVASFTVIENPDSYGILIYDEDLSNIKVYYSRLFKDELRNDSNYIESLKDTFISFDVPSINKVGYMTTKDSLYRYPLIESMYDGYFMIDEVNDLYLVKYAY